MVVMCVSLARSARAMAPVDAAPRFDSDTTQQVSLSQFETAEGTPAALGNNTMRKPKYFGTDIRVKIINRNGNDVVITLKNKDGGVIEKRVVPENGKARHVIWFRDVSCRDAPHKVCISGKGARPKCKSPKRKCG